MNSRTALILLFSTILLSLLCCTLWASWQQPVWEWQGLTREPDRWWTLATLLDAYYGFLTFFAWVCFKERAHRARLGWFLLIMTLGNMAMAAYVLIQLFRLKPGEPTHTLLLRRA